MGPLNLAAESFDSSANQLVILQYHHVDPKTPDSTSISPQQFLIHMEHLATNGYQIVRLEQAIDKIKRGIALADKSVAITFDDGYKNLARFALPELQKRKWPATIFINPGLLEKHSSHYLSWDELKHWSLQGMTIANHGWQHDYWIRREAGYSAKEWQQKIKTSILETEKSIKQQIGVSHKLVAYPYGEYDTWLQSWLIDNQFISFGQQSGVVASYSDFSALPRYPASGVYADISTLKQKLNTFALPIDYQKLPSPLAMTENPPQLHLSWLNESFAVDTRFACYVSGQGKAEILAEVKRVKIQAQKPLNLGRSRYNCTLPVKGKPNYYYWFSQPWLSLESLD
ncbi:hypothetical protein XM47_05245 [Catenovulum maritimum]|uniref:NodB homology domain-containing protein n=2 Tax=Catenovulum maritimum TaxID=1513271 RepID=A0A0J8GZL2_9ALTE|nr:hypothetical protein XM47_05245 [Catenovulum maritimum]